MRWRQSDFTFLKNWHFYLYDGALSAGAQVLLLFIQNISLILIGLKHTHKSP